MSDEALRALLREAATSNDVRAWMRAAQQARRVAGDSRSALATAASALDRAFGLSPDDGDVALARKDVLDRLEVREHGLVFRYVPAGPFLMGSTDGDPDERPVHERELDAFWMSDVPVSWPRYCELMGWESPEASGLPRADDLSTRELIVDLGKGRTVQGDSFLLYEATKVRRFYCSDQEPPLDPVESGVSEHKPMAAASTQEAEWLAERLTALGGGALFALPTEAAWEKAARGGLVGRRYAWGDDHPQGRCDFDSFDRISILPSRTFPPNGYGLYAMCGGVWEWTSDLYDARAYERPGEPPPAGATERVLRGGSWADCAEAVRVAYRMSRAVDKLGFGSPNVGFRLVRVEP